LPRAAAKTNRGLIFRFVFITKFRKDVVFMTKTKKLTISAMFIALYVTVMYFTQSFAFGAYQIRIATSIYAFSYFFPFLIIPLGAANLLSNMLLGGFGIFDIVGGFLVGCATTGLIVLIRRLNWNSILVAVPIIIIPGLGVAAWLSYLLNIPYLIMAAQLVVGQIIPGIVGMAMVKIFQSRFIGKAASYVKSNI
jgi:uncharacterized membrane protein